MDDDFSVLNLPGLVPIFIRKRDKISVSDRLHLTVHINIARTDDQIILQDVANRYHVDVDHRSQHYADIFEWRHEVLFSRLRPKYNERTFESYDVSEDYQQGDRERTIKRYEAYQQKMMTRQSTGQAKTTKPTVEKATTSYAIGKLFGKTKTSTSRRSVKRVTSDDKAGSRFYNTNFTLWRSLVRRRNDDPPKPSEDILSSEAVEGVEKTPKGHGHQLRRMPK